MNNSAQYNKGDVIGGKITVHEVLTGGMGHVYLGFDLHGNPIALKTLRQDYSLNVDAQQSFKDEIRIWVSLDKHQNIVRCFGIQILDGYPFIMMEWVIGDEGRGMNLRDRIRVFPLDTQSAMDFVIDICRGLVHAQEKVPGIVHCDLKPENILIARGGIAKITDFGLASDGETRGNVSGTPHYMAPEQWTGQQLDGRTDIYAVGCIFFELLTGSTPFAFVSISDLRNHHFSSPIPFISDYQQVPRSLQKVVERCMAKDLKDRYQNARDLLRDLEDIYINLFNKRPKPLLVNTRLTAYELLNKALAYYTVQRVDEALNTLNLAILSSDDFLLAFVFRSDMYIGLGKFDLALADAERAIKIDPLSALGYLARAAVCLNFPNGNVNLLDDIHRAFELDAHNPFGYVVRSQYFIYLYKHQEALSDIQKAEQYIPRHWLIYLIRAQINVFLQRLDLARKDLQECKAQWQYIPLNIRSDILATNAEIYIALGQYDLALQEVNQALQQIMHFKYLLTRARILSALHKNDEALDDVNFAIKLFPDVAISYVNRAAIEIELRKPKDALEDLYIAMRKGPDVWHIHHYLALIFLQMNKPDDALRELDNVRKLINELPPDSLVQFETCIGLAYVQKKDFALGKKRLDFAVAIASNLRPLIKAVAFLQRGLANIEMGLWRQASNDLQSAYECDRNFAQVFFGMGVLSICQNDFENAKRHFEQANNLGMNIPYVYHLMALNDGGKALRDIFEKILETDTYSKFEDLRLHELALQDPAFVPVVQNMFISATDAAGLLEMPENWRQILDWISSSNFGSLKERQ